MFTSIANDPATIANIVAAFSAHVNASIYEVKVGDECIPALIPDLPFGPSEEWPVEEVYAGRERIFPEEEDFFPDKEDYVNKEEIFENEDDFPF